MISARLLKTEHIRTVFNGRRSPSLNLKQLPTARRPFYHSAIYYTMAEQRPQRGIQRPAIFVCDIQEKFRNAIYEFDKVVLTTRKVLRAAQILNVPIYATTQNRARLGDTVSELRPFVTDNESLARAHVDKTRFSMWVPEIQAHFASGGDRAGERHTVALVGIEAHICIAQTALDLLRAGHAVYVLADGVSSCNREEVGIALARLRAAGATVTTSEGWLYELAGDAAIPEFKSIVALVKETAGDTRTALGALLGQGSGPGAKI